MLRSCGMYDLPSPRAQIVVRSVGGVGAADFRHRHHRLLISCAIVQVVIIVSSCRSPLPTIMKRPPRPLSPLVRDFTVAGDSWPSVQGRSRPWHGSAIVLDHPPRRDFQNINSTFFHIHLVHFRFYPPSLFLHATPMFLATFPTRGRRSTSIHQ